VQQIRASFRNRLISFRGNIARLTIFAAILEKDLKGKFVSPNDPGYRVFRLLGSIELG
jgi:hypothetical protein